MSDRLEACYFGGREWDRLAAVLRYSARLRCPSWAVNVARITPRPCQSPLGVPGHVVNTQKLDWWAERVATAADGDRIALLDADTMVLRALDDVWDLDFDLAYTTKPGARYPFNGGVVFLRAGVRSRQIMAAWQRENRRLLSNPVEHQRWRARYGGCNQAALGSILEAGIATRLAELPCVEWNCEDESWRTADLGKVRIVHVKSRLKLTVFRQLGSDKALAQLADLWRQLEREARRTAAQEVVA